MLDGPRIYCIPASQAPVLAVIRRGPSDWCHIGRWDLAEAAFHSGAWLRGTVFPQKCDLSPDGRWLLCSVHKGGAKWAGGEVYEAISRLPWLTALAAWEAGTTYTRGFHFDEEQGASEVGEPDFGDATPCLARYGLKVTRAIQFAVERRRGWIETADTEARERGGHWDEGRHVRMEKHGLASAQGKVLYVEGTYAAFRSLHNARDPATYSLEVDGERRELAGIQWADWDATGRLLVATTAGKLQIREPSGDAGSVVFEEDLDPLTPQPEPAPDWATKW